MTDQLRISDSGDIEVQPLTWDGEPLWSQSTIKETPHLFTPEAFEQIEGQTALETDAPTCKKCGAPAVFPRYAIPDLCAVCERAAWDHIDALNADRPGVPGNNITNVWD